MAYQLSTVRTRVGQKLDDTAFDTSKLNQFINDGQRDILNSRRFTFMERESSVTTSVSSSSLTSLPTDMQTPISLRIYSPVAYAVPLGYIEYDDFDEFLANQNLVGNTVPSAWYTFNNTPYVYPNADNTYTLRLKYLKAPAELTDDGDIPEIPEAFSEVLVLAAYRRALEHNDDYDQAQLIQQQIDAQLQNMTGRYKRQIGTPHIMKQPNNRRQIMRGRVGGM